MKSISKLTAALRARFDLLILSAVLAVLTIFYVRYAPIHLAHYTDPVIYLSGAESLAEGQGYHFVAHANSPRIGCHPPLQSAYLSLFWRLHPHFPENVPLLYAAMTLCALATFVLFYRYCLKNGMPALLAGALILSWGLSREWGALLAGFMSDVLFGFLVLLLAFCWQRAPSVDCWRRWLLTGGIVTLMYLTRTAALPIIGALFLVVLWRAWRQKQIKPMLAYLAPVVPGILLWGLWGANSPGYGDYVRYRIQQEGGAAPLVRFCRDTAQEYLCGMGFVRTIFGPLMDMPSNSLVATTTWAPVLTAMTLSLCWLFTFLWVSGCWRSVQVKERVFGFVLMAYLAQLCLYPENLSHRALYAIVPFVAVWAWKGRARMPRALTASRVVQGGLAIGLALNIVGNATSYAQSMTYLNATGYQDELREVGEWFRQNSPPDAVVAATIFEPVLHFYHYSGRKVVENYFQRAPWFSVADRSIIGSGRADYLLLDWYSCLAIEDLNFRSWHLEKASSGGRYRLYRIGTGQARVSEPGVALN